jgi:putative membrane protein
MEMLLGNLIADSTNGWDHSGWWPVWPLLWLVVLGTIVWLVVRKGRWCRGGRHHANEILAERYARGEVSTEEYRERLEQLR